MIRWVQESIRRVRSRKATWAMLGAVSLAAFGAAPCTAPEDSWRLVLEIPGTPGPEVIATRIMDRFLESHNVRLQPEMRATIAQAVAEQSRRHGIRPGILLSVILAESSFRTDAVSDKGAVGLMQILPSTAQAIAAEMDLAWKDDAHLTDPRLNIALGSYYLRRLLEIYKGDLHLALAAYNMGPGKLQTLLAAAPEASARFSSSYSRSIVARL